MSFVQQILQPGGGVMLLPFVRLVIGILMMLTIGAFVSGVARIHMAVLTVLSGGLLMSLSFFENEYKKAQSRLNGSKPPPQTAPRSSSTSGTKAAKTD